MGLRACTCGADAVRLVFPTLTWLACPHLADAPLDHQAAVPLAFNANARLDKSASRHLKATVWRLARAARRDKRGLFMQVCSGSR